MKMFSNTEMTEIGLVCRYYNHLLKDSPGDSSLIALHKFMYNLKEYGVGFHCKVRRSGEMEIHTHGLWYHQIPEFKLTLADKDVGYVNRLTQRVNITLRGARNPIDAIKYWFGLVELETEWVTDNLLIYNGKTYPQITLGKTNESREKKARKGRF